MESIRRCDVRTEYREHDIKGKPNGMWWQTRSQDLLMLVAILLLLSGYSFSSRVLASEGEVAGMTLDQVESGQLLYRITPPPQESAQRRDDATSGNMPVSTTVIKYRPATLLEETVDIKVAGLIVTARVTQRFRNDTSDWLEAVYAFPLPENAALYDMNMRIGERLITGEIKEKQLAKKIYQQAKQAGKKAALVEQHRPNLFTNNVANIPPGEIIEVTLEYNQVLDYQQGGFELRFPLTTTPRYMPGKTALDAETASAIADRYNQLHQAPTIDGATGWAMPTDQVPDAHLISPFTIPSQAMPDNSHQVGITIEILAGFPISVLESVTHSIEVDSQGRGAQEIHRVSLSSKSVAMDREFVLAWKPETGAEPQAALFTETWQGENYSLLMVMPPQQLPEESMLPREQIFVVDTSGSMGGDSIRQARSALQNALKSLKPSDRFNVIEFNSATHSLYQGSVPADPRHINEALSYVNGLNASGGTEMASALQAALATSVYPGYLRQVVFITDGSVGNETALFQQIERDLGESRLFTIGIGSAPNGYFMRKAAEFGRGSYTMISDVSEVQHKLKALFAKLRTPVLSDLALNASADATALYNEFESYPARMGDLYVGEPVVQVVKHSESVKQLSLSANSMGMYQSNTPLWEQTINLVGAKPAKGIATYWGRMKIESLLDSVVTGASKEQVRNQVTEVALKHHLVSPYTSLVAVEQVVSRPSGAPLNKEGVPQLLPRGSGQSMARFPQTATSSRLYILVGLLCYLIGIGMLYQYRPIAPFKKRLA